MLIFAKIMLVVVSFIFGMVAGFIVGDDDSENGLSFCIVVSLACGLAAAFV